ncbi:MAG: transglutaminase domain-containing protein [Ignavibacteriales bacterium]|nr:transglutaminase domain-containing protein [Ignavibacteriales bacterium]
MKKEKLLLLSSLLLLSLGVNSCTFIENSNKDTQNHITHNWLGEPRFVEAELLVIIKNVEILKGDSLINHNKRMGIPKNTPPTFRLWSSQPKNYINQRDVQYLSVSPAPTESFTEDENQNLIHYWDLMKSLKTGDSLVISRKVRYTVYNLTTPDNIDQINSSAFFEDDPTRFLISEEFLEITDSIKAKAAEVTVGETNSVKKTKLLYDWVRGNMEYTWNVPERSAESALRTCSGDCGQFSYLFIALCRASGIPARLVSGFMLAPDTISYHVWSEVQFPGTGWLPVDCTDKNGFLSLDNRRLVTSRGMNIPLFNVPEWADYKNSEAKEDRTDFMQMVTVVMSGVKANIRTQRIIHKFTK